MGILTVIQCEAAAQFFASSFVRNFDAYQYVLNAITQLIFLLLVWFMLFSLMFVYCFLLLLFIERIHMII